ncbi:hypothetical protein MIND_00913100 [Mycena indigotica]|uniref:Blue (type 1) copper domain-containing protein n=1 Tax=Mycena indigotica TaxID=2126181 RepID=A0A8H6VYT4_9AGAR|nr:uncharacterized protein MIND_00913100 [Mycena indigotica]KAF7296821.1 hypothetical protein MIND_00913100 [Mycena indigotica]
MTDWSLALFRQTLRTYEPYSPSSRRNYRILPILSWSFAVVVPGGNVNACRLRENTPRPMPRAIKPPTPHWQTPTSRTSMFAKALLLFLAPAAVIAVDHAVAVGANNGLTFTPTVVTAAVGDTITFTVLSRNHTITSAPFSGAICPPPTGGVGPNAFDSGFLSDLDGSQPTFVYTVKDTVPHFASCQQAAGAHCRAGMTFAINPNATQTFAQFTANAAKS